MYKRAIAIKPDYAGAYNNLANAYQGMGKLDEATTLYKKALSFKPGYPEALNNLGVVYKNSSKIDAAIALYNKAVEVNPFYAVSYKNLAVAYYLQGEYGMAINVPARQALLKAGIPVEVVSMTIDTACCSSMDGVNLGVRAAKLGIARTILAM